MPAVKKAGITATSCISQFFRLERSSVSFSGLMQKATITADVQAKNVVPSVVAAAKAVLGDRQKENGVAVIYQELNLCSPLTVAENIFLGRPQAKLYSQRQVNKLAQEIFDEYGFDLKPNVPVAALPPASQQLVEI